MSRFAKTRAAIAALGLIQGLMWWTSASDAAPERGAVVSTTEDGLVATALVNNPRLRAAQWDRNIAEAQVTTATALNNPVVRFQWIHVQDGDPIVQDGVPEAAAWAVRLSWTPPQPWEWSARRAEARARTVEVEQDLLERAVDLEASIREGCATADALSQHLAIASRALETRRAIRTMIEARVERGASTRLQLNAAALSAARAVQDKAEIVVARGAVLRRLAAYAGLPAGTDLDLTPAASAEGPAGRVPEEKELEAQALLRPLFRADAARAEEATQALRAEKTKRYPWITFSSMPRLRVSTDSKEVHDWTLGIDVTLPIFNGNGGRIAAADAELRRQEALRAAHVSEVRRDIEIARDETIQRTEVLAGYHTTIDPILDEHAALLREALEGRQVDFLALLTAEDVVVRTQHESVDAQLAYRKAQVQLLRASGGLTAGVPRR